jgi:hypothetical protein
MQISLCGLFFDEFVGFDRFQAVRPRRQTGILPAVAHLESVTVAASFAEADLDLTPVDLRA